MRNFKLDISRFRKPFILLSFFSFFILFLFAGQLQSKAKDLGFGPALLDTGNCIIGSAPCDPSSAQEVHLFQPGANSTSALAASSQLIDKMYASPPNSAVVWAYDQVQQVRNKELLAVYAQASTASTSFYFPGLGYDLLMPMLGLWQWSRNTVYIFYVIIVIVLSALILFRQQLSGSAAVSVINSLPSLILSLVLVTLSYPIAGFFVDLIYIGANVAQGLLITSDGAPGYEFTQSDSFQFRNQNNNNVFYLQPDDPQMSIWAIWGTAKTEVFPEDCVGNKNKPCSSNLLPNFEGQDSVVLRFVGEVMQVSEKTANVIVGNVSGNSLINLILGLTALMASFRLFLTLLKNYVLLTLSPLYLPWMFLFAAIPSRTKSSIVNALKPLAAASLSFVAVYVLFLIMIIIGRSAEMNETAFNRVGQFTFAPPLLGYDPDSLIMADQSITRTLIIYILFLAAPTIPDMVNSFLNVQSSSQLAGQVGSNASKGFSTLFGGLQKASTFVPGRGKKDKG